MIKNDQKRRILALQVAQTSTTFIQALNDLIEIGQQIAQSGLSFADVDFATEPDLEHLDGAVIAGVLTSAEATRDWLQTSFNATNFQKARAR